MEEIQTAEQEKKHREDVIGLTKQKLRNELGH